MLDVVIDLSHHNTLTETSFLEAAAAGIQGCLHKITEGTWYLDGTYAERQEWARAAGVWWGAYHFGRSGDAVGQAHYFLEQVQPTPDTLLVLDWETCPSDVSMSRAEAEAFVEVIAQDTGRYPGVYSGMSFCGDALTGLTATDTVLSQCWLWLARYSETPPEVPPVWPTWSMWQYTQEGRVPGIAGPCDRDRFNGDLDGLRRLWGVAPAPMA
jgi:lysozyme